MRAFQGAAQEVAAKHPRVFNAQKHPIYSFDNAPIHQAAEDDLCKLGIYPSRRAPLPPSSPDMHKCIEHVFGTMSNALQASLHRKPHLSTADQYRQEVLDLFFNAITPASVQKDVASLKDTYRAILAKAGDWPAKPFR